MSWLTIPAESDFSLANLPLGVADTQGLPPRLFIAVGEHAVDLAAATAAGVWDESLAPLHLLQQPTANAYLAEMRHKGYEVLRLTLQNQLRTEGSALHQAADRVLVKQADLTLHLPIHVPDYTDFYASETHATNVGALFRPENPLLPNWKHLPIGYHGRASSIVLSGTPIRRPHGQRKNPEGTPVFGPSKRLDYELELAAVIDTPNGLGHPVPIAEAEEHIFGYLLFNDWSARDIQAWEYQPLGPFLGKNFASSVSPWLVPRAALAHVKTAGPIPTEPLLPYLQSTSPAHLDLPLHVFIRPAAGENYHVSTSNAKDLYWSFPQMVAHHTVSGCNLRVGDVLASGTASSPRAADAPVNTFGCLLELTKGGKEPLALAGEYTRSFLEDGDTVTLSGGVETPEGRVGFGPCSGQVVP